MAQRDVSFRKGGIFFLSFIFLFQEIHDINALNLLVHGGNSLVMICEIAVTAQPIRAAHALYGAGTGLVYGVFSAFYWAVGGTDRGGKQAIYSLLDWNKPGK